MGAEGGVGERARPGRPQDHTGLDVSALLPYSLPIHPLLSCGYSDPQQGTDPKGPQHSPASVARERGLGRGEGVWPGGRAHSPSSSSGSAGGGSCSPTCSCSCPSSACKTRSTPQCPECRTVYSPAPDPWALSRERCPTAAWGPEASDHPGEVGQWWAECRGERKGPPRASLTMSTSGRMVQAMVNSRGNCMMSAQTLSGQDEGGGDSRPRDSVFVLVPPSLFSWALVEGCECHSDE